MCKRDDALSVEDSLASGPKALDDGPTIGPEEATSRREFGEATSTDDEFDEITARQEYTEALARERALAGATVDSGTAGARVGSSPIEPPDTDKSPDIQEMLQPPASLQEWPQGDQLRVMVVEDDQEAGDKLCQQLSMSGHAALLVGSNEDLLRILVAKMPQLILLNVELTPRSGYLICNLIKQHDQLREVPLLLISSEATEETFRQHRKLVTRADDYLIKPYAVETLLKKVTGLSSPGAAQEVAAVDDASSSGFPTWALLVFALVVVGAAVGVVLYVI